MHELPTNFDGFETCNVGTQFFLKILFCTRNNPSKRRKTTKKRFFYKFQIDQAVMFGATFFLLRF